MTTTAAADLEAAAQTAEPTLTELLAEREAEAFDLLDAPWWKPWTWARRPWDSEARKSLARIATSIAEARSLLARRASLQGREDELGRLLERPLAGRGLDTLIELVYALDCLLVDAGDSASLRRRFCAEKVPDGDTVALADIEHGLADSKPVVDAEVSARLRALYEMRRFRYRRMRARRRMKSFHLVTAGLLVLALAAALGWSIDRAIGGDDADVVLLAAFAGALGGTIANLLKLRDDLSRGTELRAFKPMLLAQPAVGAASGLVLLLVLESGFLGIVEGAAEARWTTTTLLAFVAGFSEAFFLEIVRKAAAAVSDDEPTAKETRETKVAGP